MPIYKGRKEDLGNYRPVSLTAVPRKVMEKIISSAITRHVQNNQRIRPSQQVFMKDRRSPESQEIHYNLGIATKPEPSPGTEPNLP
ncbi:hypothetical protein BTVI_141348 [Pitangus sulphuratus]|nr:hypothetical protein BTVI_141348 [Pitangus sulphuratus]